MPTVPIDRARTTAAASPAVRTAITPTRRLSITDHSQGRPRGGADEPGAPRRPQSGARDGSSDQHRGPGWSLPAPDGPLATAANAGSPSPGCQVPSDGFSVRWTRTAAFEAPASSGET